MIDSCKSILNDGRLTVVLFFLVGLFAIDFADDHNFSFFERNKTNGSCTQLHFAHPDKLVIENCLESGSDQENDTVPAKLTPLLFVAMPINSADTDMLMTVKGIGPALAEDIVLYRHQFGPFTSSTDLLNLHGIGPKRAANFATVFTFAEVP